MPAAVTHTVIKGDTLSAIAAKYNTTVANLVAANDISDPNHIVIGQTLTISNGETAKPTQTTNLGSRPIIKVFGVQSQTSRLMYATWSWDVENTKDYTVKWTYFTGDGVDFVGSETNTELKQSTYNAPENAKGVKFRVKANAKTTKINGKEAPYWTSDWSSSQTYYFSSNVPPIPQGLVVELDDFKLTATLDNLDTNAKQIQFEVVKDNTEVFKNGKATITTGHASWSCTVAEGGEYKVRCRGVRDYTYGEWSEYSNNFKTKPSPPKSITKLNALSTTSVYIEWDKVSTAESYDIQYTTNVDYFDSSGEVQTTSVEAIVTHAEILGMTSGEEYFFRVCAVNDEDKRSTWTKVKSIKIGKAPSPPTTWSSTTTVEVGEPLSLYWTHNTEDGSSQTYAILELDVDGIVTTQTIKNSTEDDEKDKTSVYVVSTSGYAEGTKIQWRVKTKGITDTYSEWSIQRSIDVYAPPVITFDVVDASGNQISSLSSFPFYVTANTWPNTQTPIGFHITIVANETYETVDHMGNTSVIPSGSEVYSKYLDVSSLSRFVISASDVSLDNNVSYTITCSVSMDSGLRAEYSQTFAVSWADVTYSPKAEIIYDSDTIVTYIRPYCGDANGRLMPGLSMSLYRREFDGSFTELATGLNNLSRTYITDPHPSLDYARYRVVAMDENSGTISYADIAGYPIGETAVIIQWDDGWSEFETNTEDELVQPPWSGSLLRLPYNIDVSDSHAPDVSLVEYIGRKHPVSYYGTQLGETSTWNVSIPKSDRETLYALRRLAVWMGDVYVREPSGSGYWAHVKVSFSQTHLDLTIPVTLDITRVSGGA